MVALHGEDVTVTNSHPLAVIADQTEEHREKVTSECWASMISQVTAMREEMEQVFSERVGEKVERMQQEERDESERVEREQQTVEREREEVARRREELVQEKLSWEGRTGVSSSFSHLAHRSSSASSLTAMRKHLSLNILPFKFGRS